MSIDPIKIVFKCLNPIKGYNKLNMAGKKWLMRESSTHEGLISVDILRKSGVCHSMRFVYEETAGWQSANNMRDLNKVDSVIPIHFSDKGFRSTITDLLHILETKYRLTQADLLKPEEHDASVNNAYACLIDGDETVYTKESIKDMCCPITMECLRFAKQPAVLNNRFYEYDAIYKWVVENGVDPFTKEVVCVDRIVKTDIFSLCKSPRLE